MHAHLQDGSNLGLRQPKALDDVVPVARAAVAAALAVARAAAARRGVVGCRGPAACRRPAADRPG